MEDNELKFTERTEVSEINDVAVFNDINNLSNKILNHWALSDTKQLGLQACNIAVQLAIENEKLKKALKTEILGNLEYECPPSCNNNWNCDTCDLLYEECAERIYNARMEQVSNEE